MARQDQEATLAAATTQPASERLEALIADFSAALAKGVGAVFVGAGVSRDAGLPGWSDLLAGPAAELGIQLTSQDDLAAIAQYYVNHYHGNRGPLVRAVIDQLGDHRRLSPLHEAISRMNVSAVWTTNYDTLLEQAFQGFNVRVRVKDDEVRETAPSHEIEIVKLHDCIMRAGARDLVITQEDYEDYFRCRPGIAKRLETALQDRMFLFVGYSYRDPNIHGILTEARRILAGATRKHYMLQIRKSDPAEAPRQRLWASDLMRFGIECVLLDDPEQMRTTLDRIAERCRGATVYVTGGHRVGNGDRAARFATELGQQLAEHDRLVLLDGQSAGVGRAAVTGFMTRCIERNADLEQRLRLFPNPYAANPRFSDDKALLPMLKRWRAKLMQAAAIVIAIDGGMGTRAELEVARERGCRIIPIVTQEGAAKEIWADAAATRWLHDLDPGLLTRMQTGQATPQEVSHVAARALRLAERDPRAAGIASPGHA